MATQSVPADKVGINSVDDKSDSFLSALIVLLTMTIGQKLVGFLRSVLVCRLLPPEELGTWALMNTLIVTVSPFVLLSIPACFGRYLEVYRGKSQLRGFIRQAGWICMFAVSCGMVGLLVFQGPIARLGLGDSQLSWIVAASTLAIVPFALFSFSMELLLALRHGKAATTANFVSTLTLAVVSIGLLVCWQATAYSMLAAAALAYLIPLLWSARHLHRVWSELPSDSRPLPWRSTWLAMVPVVALFWFTDILTNLFYTVDRYMLANLLPGGSDEILRQIGNYESAHVIPLLYSVVTVWIGRVLMPYMSRAWESGERELVVNQVNFAIKLVVWVAVSSGLGLLFLSDWLYAVLFAGKYGNAVEVLPYLVLFYIGCGTTVLLMNYFWCVGKAQWAPVALIAGVITNSVVNYLLIPELGIRGAAMGTGFGIAAQVVALLGLARCFGLRWDWGIAVIGVGSLVLLLDRSYLIPGLFVFCLIVLIPGVLSPWERTQLRDASQALREKLRRGQT